MTAAAKKPATKAVAKKQRDEAVAPTNDADTIIRLIDKLVAMPDLPVERIEKMLAIHERMREEQARRAFNSALAEAQKSLKPIVKDADNKQTSSKYASLVALDEIARPIYTEQGFSLTYTTEDGAPENEIRVVCYVSHVDGYERRYQLDMPADGKGPKGNAVMTRTHAAGSAVKYGRRYLLEMIFNLVTKKDDDDGNAAGNRAAAKVLTDEQVTALQKLIKNAGVDVNVVLEAVNAPSVSNIKASQYASLCKKLKTTIDAGGAQQ